MFVRRGEEGGREEISEREKEREMGGRGRVAFVIVR